jgi:2-dehydro-3-deoxyphosphooctonate aldolase (KDO 8-P synthase)
MNKKNNKSVNPKRVKIGNITIGQGKPLVLIAGPCVIENKDITFEIAEKLIQITKKMHIPFIFKASYDKANRSSIDSFRGPGLDKGLKILSALKKKHNLLVLSDVHCKSEVEKAGKILDIIQIPAFLCRQTDLLTTAAKTKKPINIKKGQFVAPLDMKNAIEKVKVTGNNDAFVTERGTFFGYNNLVVDFRSIPQMQSLGCPVIFDGTHSVQLPGGQGISSGGEIQFVMPLIKAAVAAGCDGIFIEVHTNPKKALCDGPNSLDIKDLPKLLETVKKLSKI